MEWYGIDHTSDLVTADFAKADSCKWWNLVCHAGNFWNWLCTKPAGSSRSRAQQIGDVLSVIEFAVALYLTLTSDDD